MDDIAALKEQLAHPWAREEIDLDALERVLEDAERYRWHRAAGGRSWTHLEAQQPATGGLFDAATDAAMAANGGPERVTLEFEKWCSSEGAYLSDGDDVAKAAKLMARRAWIAGVASERERLRGYFRDALSDHGITWPGEVDILYDKCFGAPYVPDEAL